MVDDFPIVQLMHEFSFSRPIFFPIQSKLDFWVFQNGNLKQS